MPFLPPNQQCQSTEGNASMQYSSNITVSKLAINQSFNHQQQRGILKVILPKNHPWLESTTNRHSQLQNNGLLQDTSAQILHQNS